MVEIQEIEVNEEMGEVEEKVNIAESFEEKKIVAEKEIKFDSEVVIETESELVPTDIVKEDKIYSNRTDVFKSIFSARSLSKF